MSKSNHKDKMVSKSASRGVWGGLLLSFKLKAKGPLGCFSRWAEARMSSKTYGSEATSKAGC